MVKDTLYAALLSLSVSAAVGQVTLVDFSNGESQTSWVAENDPGTYRGNQIVTS